MTTILLAVNPSRQAQAWHAELAARRGWAVAGPAHSLLDARRLAAADPPALLVADLRLGDGNLLALIHLLQAGRTAARLPVLVLAPDQADPLLLDLLQAGADNFFTTTGARPGALAEQVQGALAGEAQIAPWIARRLLDYFQVRQHGAPPGAVEDLSNPLALTTAECTLLCQVSVGDRLSELARREGVRPLDLAARVRAVYRKMQWALRAGDLRLA